MCTYDIIYFTWQPALGVARLHPVVAEMGSSLSAVWVAIENVCIDVCVYGWMDDGWEIFFPLDKEDTLSSLWIIKPFEEVIYKTHIATDVFLIIQRWLGGQELQNNSMINCSPNWNQRVHVHVVLFNVNVKTLDFKFPIMFTCSSCPFTHQCFFYMSIRLEPSSRIFAGFDIPWWNVETK